MKKSRHWLFSLLLWLFILGGLIGVWFFVKTKSAITPSEPQTIKVTKRNFSASVTCTGAVKPCIGAEVRVGARISGRVDRLFANIGDVVRKGQVIAILEKADGC
jgi:macrolide-specific efflux system membrane fusion protein